MRSRVICLVTAGLLVGLASSYADQPLTYELKLVYIFEATPTEYVFVIGNSGFRTVEALQRFIGTRPPGTTIRWSPGCVRMGDEPLLSNERDMEEFAAFCRRHQINFELVPSG